MATQVSDEARIMATGPHPDWRARAAAADHFAYSLTELLSVGGNALARFLGREWYDRSQETFRSMLDLLERTALAEVAQGSRTAASP